MQLLELVSPPECPAPSKITLSPSQQTAADGVLRGLERGDCAVLQDSGSSGKTTILNYVYEKLGGARISVREFLAKLASYGPMAMEEAFFALIDAAIAGRHDLMKRRARRFSARGLRRFLRLGTRPISMCSRRCGGTAAIIASASAQGGEEAGFGFTANRKTA